MDLVAAIVERYSVRRYQRRAVPDDVIGQVYAAGRNSLALRPEIAVRWYVVWDGSLLAQHLSGLAGVCDIFTSAPHYVIAVSQERPGFMENLGFRMEQLILAATALGLGTCWIGQMFVEEDLHSIVPDLEPGERIVALTPLGYADESSSAQLVRQLARWGSERQGARKPLSEIVSRDFWTVPWTSGLQPEDQALERILELTRLAPSWDNTQPWHFIVDTVADDASPGLHAPDTAYAPDTEYTRGQVRTKVIATVNHTMSRGNIRGGKPYYRLDGGIAMCHLYLAARATRWQPARSARPAEPTRLGTPAWLGDPRGLRRAAYIERGPNQKPTSVRPFSLRRAPSRRRAIEQPWDAESASPALPAPSWHILPAAERAQMRSRYGIPVEYDILGVFC